MKYIVRVGESEFDIEIDRNGEIRLDGAVIDSDLQPSADSTLYSLILGRRSHRLRVEPCEGMYRVQLEGVTHEVVVEDERTRRLAGVKSPFGAGSGETVIKSPMPGIVIDVPVNEGDAVEAGQTLAVVESMKMHNDFKAPRPGTVHAVRARAGDKVNQGQILVTLA
jgi:biotin carboxyl carrier protein